MVFRHIPVYRSNFDLLNFGKMMGCTIGVLQSCHELVFVTMYSQLCSKVGLTNFFWSYRLSFVWRRIGKLDPNWTPAFQSKLDWLNGEQPQKILILLSLLLLFHSIEQFEDPQEIHGRSRQRPRSLRRHRLHLPMGNIKSVHTFSQRPQYTNFLRWR